MGGPNPFNLRRLTEIEPSLHMQQSTHTSRPSAVLRGGAKDLRFTIYEAPNLAHGDGAATGIDHGGNEYTSSNRHSAIATRRL